jgi:hypothetical protein
MNNVIIFALHNEQKILNTIHAGPSVKKINLNDLDLQPKYANNSLAENRFFIYLSKNINILKDYDYIGVCSASWDFKYKTLNKNSNVIEFQKISELAEELEDPFIYVPSLVEDWYNESIFNHAGIEVYIDELLKRNNFISTGNSFYSNNFICKKSIFINFIKWWKVEFDYFFEKYRYTYHYNSENYENYKPDVNCSYFYERLTIAYFANKKYNIFQLDPKKMIMPDVLKKNRTILEREKRIKNFNDNSKLF